MERSTRGDGMPDRSTLHIGEVVQMSDELARESASWRFAVRALVFFGGLAARLRPSGSSASSGWSSRCGDGSWVSGRLSARHRISCEGTCSEMPSGRQAQRRSSAFLERSRSVVFSKRFSSVRQRMIRSRCWAQQQ
jgi:hypothetical protein